VDVDIEPNRQASVYGLLDGDIDGHGGGRGVERAVCQERQQAKGQP
jgi:hypothetical protein